LGGQIGLEVSPLLDFFDIIAANIAVNKAGARLPNNIIAHSWLRRWFPFKKTTNSLEAHYGSMQIRSECFLAPGKAYTCIAWNN
jgi:hypothetical protein